MYKALALGARAVGIGRSSLYGLAAYGEAGARRVIDMLTEELAVTMRLMSRPGLEAVGPDSLVARSLPEHVGAAPRDYLAERSYEPLALRAPPGSRL